jgi:hypothetical protein
MPTTTSRWQKNHDAGERQAVPFVPHEVADARQQTSISAATITSQAMPWKCACRSGSLAQPLQDHLECLAVDRLTCNVLATLSHSRLTADTPKAVLTTARPEQIKNQICRTDGP